MSNVGTIIYGFCQGYFGRDDYNTKVIIFETRRSIVCGVDGNLRCANFESEDEKNECIERWSKEEHE